jgi:hydrogenase/urease accessory protein HupE
MKKSAILATALAVVSSPAFAHPGHGVFNGLVHPAEKLDMLMLTVAGIGVTALIGWLFRRG